MATVPSEEGVVRQSVFEGLFVHVLELPAVGPLADALRTVGYDLRRQEPEYPARVWKDALAVTCRMRYPDLSGEEAMRTLGRSFIEGFLRTVAGRALGVLLPMIGTEAALRRLERFMSMGVPQLRLAATELEAKRWRLVVDARWALADFDAGLIEAGLRRTGSEVKVSVLEREVDRYALAVRW